HRGFGKQALGDSFEAQNRKSGGQFDRARFGDEGKTLRPIGVDWPAPPRWRAIDSNRDIIDSRRDDDGGRLLRERRQGRQQRRDANQPPEGPQRALLNSVYRRWR